MKRILLIFAVLGNLLASGFTPDYGPTDYNVITSTSQGFIVINELSIGGNSVVSGTNNNTAFGFCPSQNCDIIAVMYGNICVGWSYSTIINNQIFITVNFNDQITPYVNGYPNFGDSVTLNFFDTSEGVMYYGIASTEVNPLSQSVIPFIDINGDGEFASEDGGCPLYFDPNFDAFAGMGDCSLCFEDYLFCGCTDPEAITFNPIATVNDNSCEYGFHFQHSLSNGNNLIGLPGYFENTSTLNVLEDLLNTDVHINFLLGQGLGIFNTAEGWSGNLNFVDAHSGYWINTSSSIDWDLYFDLGKVEDCEDYEISFGNNLISFKWGNGYAPTMEALGGEEFATENFNFILGQGVGLFNTSVGWAGNLNFLAEGKGYWLNVNNSNIDFKWGIDNCENPPEIQSLGKENIELPDEFQFNQSTEQAFYLINNNGYEYSNDDLILAYNNNVLVGSAYFDPNITVLPVMGNDLTESTDGYCETGDSPELKLYKSSTDEIIDLNTQLESFENLKITELHLSKFENQNELASEFEINSVYPNPFNPSTNISYELPVDGIVSISIMDISGRILTVIENGFKKSGDYNLNWNANNFASGTYFIKIDFKSEQTQITKTQKVVLIK